MSTAVILPHPLHTSRDESGETTWSVLDLVTRLTLVVLLIKVQILPPDWYLQVSAESATLAGFCFSRLRRSWAFWYTLALIEGLGVMTDWASADNHHYLGAYWCVALAGSFSLPPAQRPRAAAFSGRVLIGLCMLFATLWKAITPDYLDGRFFEYTLLTDSRFADLTTAISGISPAILAENRALEGMLADGYLRGPTIPAVRIVSSPQVSAMATFLTWWTILIEGGLALLFLLPDRRITFWIRNTALLAFAISTYAVATVYGFAWLLLVMGLAQCQDSQRRWVFWYLSVFLLVALYKMPWSGVLLTLMQ